MQATATVTESNWIPTACGMCYIGCGVLVKVEDGVVVSIEGNPDNPQNRGRMCAKGKAGIMNLYNPHRVKAPLKRTNPKKGMDEDPRWQEITWEEAIDTVVAQLKRINDDPKKLLIHAWEAVGDNIFWLKAFGSAFGTPHIMNAASPTCGKVIHPVEFFSGGGFHQQPDLHYSNYCILVGTQFAISARGSYNHIALDMAEARARGMKLISIDPVGGYAAAKADEWIPIRPGTDSALALSMLHVLLNEVAIYDGKFLKHKTNAPYLVGEDGLYLRDEATGQPLVFDAADGKVKTHDDPSLIDPSLKGAREIGDRRGCPSFELLCEHVKKYTPELTEPVTTIPAATVRRIAREFGEAASIGSTITLDGVELPLRPACVDWAKGTQGHKHGFHQCWPFKLLNLVVGAVNVPGGILSTAASGKHPHQWWPQAGKDGLLEDGGHILPLPHPKAFPGRTPVKPIRMDLGELFPLASHFHTLFPLTFEHPEEYGLNYGIEMLLHTPTNALLGTFGDLGPAEKFYQSMKFITGFAVEINETNLFDDVVLPFPAYLERYDFNTGSATHSIPPCGGGEKFHWNVRQPVVEPPPGIRHPQDVLTEIADRAGFLDGLYRLVNHTYMIREPYALKPDQRYPISAVIDRTARAWFGEDRGLDWFAEHGTISLPRDIEESYIGPGLKARLPIYLEHLVQRGSELKHVLKSMGIQWDLSDYKPISDWMPCPSYFAVQNGEYDLIAVHFKFPFVYGAYGNENPWVNELCERTEAYSILLNASVGKAKGIEDGDLVWLESPVKKVRARAKLSECIHPQAVGVGGHFGHWAPGMPISKGKGINFNSLLPTDLDHIDMISTALDHCVEVKIYK